MRGQIDRTSGQNSKIKFFSPGAGAAATAALTAAAALTRPAAPGARPDKILYHLSILDPTAAACNS